MVERKVDIVRGTNSKPASSEALAKFFAESRDYGGRLFIGYPIIAAPEGRFRIDALWLSPDHGIVIFDLIEGHAPDDFRERQDNAYNLIDAKLRAHQELTERRNLLVPVNTLSFAPGIRIEPDWEVSDYFLCNSDNLDEALRTFEHRMPSELFSKTMSALQSISTIRKSKIKRTPEKKDSLGAKLKSLESSIATLDSLQGKAVVETVEGVQRIRGLAGSGKTIVLALKAAYLHAQHPEWRIAVTFNTRSLKGQFRRLINTFCIDQTGEEPDWENLRILNAWGAPGGNHRTGVYFEFCQYQDVPYFDFQSARHRFGKGNEFGGSCEEAIKAARNIKPLYDAILVDEAQDFSPWFLRLCYRLLSSTKRLVYAYDELQNLSGESMPSPEELFGKDKNGEPLVVFSEPDPGKPKSDIILEKCYRNSRPVLTAAHALGFGIYRKPRNDQTTGLVQMFDHPYLWEEIGYRVEKGRLQDGSEVVLSRTKETSPEFLENHSPIDDLVQFVECDSMQDQIDRVADAIKENLEQDELRYDDIVLINPDPFTTRKETGPIRRRLMEMGISSHLAGVDTDPDVFFSSDHDSVTFTGINRAKGNEAGMVYIVNGQDCHASQFNLATIRNRLFTAISRSKAWVRVLGYGDGMRRLVEEFERLRANNFRLHFRYPTARERRFLKVVHRDMTAQEKNRIKHREKDLVDLVNDLEAGNIHLEDLDESYVNKLKGLLKQAV